MWPHPASQSPHWAHTDEKAKGEGKGGQGQPKGRWDSEGVGLIELCWDIF